MTLKWVVSKSDLNTPKACRTRWTGDGNAGACSSETYPAPFPRRTLPLDEFPSSTTTRDH